MEYSFTELDANLIRAHCKSDNTPSRMLLEKIDFRREGLMRKYVYFRKDDMGNPYWMDILVNARLAEE